MAAQRQKCLSRASPELLAPTREVACSEGQDVQAVSEEAAADCIESKAWQAVRPEVMTHYRASVEKNRELYELLAQ